MAFSFDFDLTNGILRCRLSGRVTDEVLLDFFRAGAEHALRTHPKTGIVDLSEVTSFEASTRTIEHLAVSRPVLSDPRLVRIVIAPSLEIYGMMRMFEIESEEVRPNLHVVHTEQEAWEILGAHNPKFEPLEAV
jgi:hypothetical protein